MRSSLSRIRPGHPFRQVAFPPAVSRSGSWRFSSKYLQTKPEPSSPHNQHFYRHLTELLRKHSVLACQGLHSKLPQAERFRRQKSIFPIVLEAGSPRSRCQQGWPLLRPLSWACRCHLLAESSQDLSSVHADP